MIEVPMDVLKQFPIRKTKKQKQAFRNSVQSYAEYLGYQVTVEKGGFAARNVVIGNPGTAKYLVTAHYDTPASMIVPNLITPCNFIAFLCYQLLVTGLILGIAFLPGLVLLALGMDSQTAALAWLVCVYSILGLMMFGPGNKSNANDNTSGVVIVLETAEKMAEDLRNKVCFILFDLEEAGLVGSSSYAKKHKKEIQNQIVLNCDCVGDGEELMMFPTKKVKKDEKMMRDLQKICCDGDRSLKLRENGFSYYPSDQKNFPYGIGIAAFRRSKLLGLYCDKIHTRKDTVLDEKNVSFLRERLTELVSSAAE